MPNNTQSQINNELSKVFSKKKTPTKKQTRKEKKAEKMKKITDSLPKYEDLSQTTKRIWG